MPGHSRAEMGQDHLIRSQLWSEQLRERLKEDLMFTKYVDWLPDFGGDVLNIPSIGDFDTNDYVENQAVKYQALDTGNFQLRITEYKQVGTYITEKMRQDSYLSSRLEGMFVPKMHRALAETMETDFLRIGPESQIQDNPNLINGAPHRWIGTGANNSLSVTDFARARNSLQKANVPMTNLVAIVDPSVEWHLNTLSAFTSLDYNPKWEGIINNGVNPTGMRFVVNIYGFDVYVSNFLKQEPTETIYGETITNGVNNLFFSAASDVLPIAGIVRQAPKVDSSYEKDLQREEYVVTCRYGGKLQREENFVNVISSNAIPDPTYT